jgi:hypothetical protein
MAQLTAEELAKIDRLNGILFPYADRRRKEMIARKGRFVHYTSAENALALNGCSPGIAEEAIAL